MRVGGVAEHQRDFAGSRHVGSNRNGQAEGGPRRRCRSIQVEELTEAVPGIVRAGRPRSQEAFIHTINREHGLHRTPQRRGNPCGCPRRGCPVIPGLGAHKGRPYGCVQDDSDLPLKGGVMGSAVTLGLIHLHR